MSCPIIAYETKEHFQVAMKQHLTCFRNSGKSPNGDKNGLVDDIKGCETAVIGEDYTWHNHINGITPSQADINTTKNLGKRFLCIGLSPEGKTTCYDLQNGMKVSCRF